MPAPRPTVTLIAAVARNGVIGRDNALPWRLPEDMAHFKARTSGRTVLMGRRTWDSLPPRFRPLPGRRNLVLSTQADWQSDGATRVGSLDEALLLAADEPELVVIGGGQVYALALPVADELVLTEVDVEVDGDARFPHWPRERFAEVSRDVHRAANGPEFAFVVYRRQPV